MFLPVYFRWLDIWFLCGLWERHNSHFFFLRFTSAKKPSIDTLELGNEVKKMEYLLLYREACRNHVYLCLIFMVWCTLQFEIELSGKRS